MKKLACALCLWLFFAGHALAENPAQIQTEVLAKSSLSWDKQELPAYPTGKPEITILKIRIPPGAQLPLHKHPFINAGVLLSGELTVMTEANKTLHLKAGQGIVEVVNTWHYGRNDGPETAEIIVFYAGTPDSPITIHK